MLRFLFVGVLVLGCIVQFQDAVKTDLELSNTVHTDAELLQEIFEDAIDKAVKVSDKLHDRLEILKDQKHTLRFWRIFKRFFHKVYTLAEEEQQRFEIFIVNLKKIIEHNFLFNKNEQSFKLNINEFGDLNLEEFLKKMTGLKVNEKIDESNKKINAERLEKMAVAEETVDYRSYMNPIQNQGQCGSCYAFSISSTVEGAYAVKKNQRFKLSEQELVDCSKNEKCDGGYFTTSFDYIKQRGGLGTNVTYPYVMKSHSCHSKAPYAGAIQGYECLPSGDEKAMTRALCTYGPLAVAINADQLQFYGPSRRPDATNIIDIRSCSKQTNHAVTLVGYGTDHGKDYWLVRNSWGADWGLNGYFKIARNNGNMCGIGSESYYVLL